MANKYLNGNDSVFVSSDSGDSLIVALLANPTMRLDVSNTNDNSNSNSNIMNISSGTTCEDASIALIINNDNDDDDNDDVSVKCSTKGFCLLFSFLQRSIRNQPYNSNSNRNDVQGRYYAVRDKLWSIAKKSIVKRMIFKRERELSSSSSTTTTTSSPPSSSLSITTVTTNTTTTTTIKPFHRVKLNGRLCDAYLRCYLDTAELALQVSSS